MVSRRDGARLEIASRQYILRQWFGACLGATLEKNAVAIVRCLIELHVLLFAIFTSRRAVTISIPFTDFPTSASGFTSADQGLATWRKQFALRVLSKRPHLPEVTHMALENSLFVYVMGIFRFEFVAPLREMQHTSIHLASRMICAALRYHGMVSLEVLSLGVAV